MMFLFLSLSSLLGFPLVKSQFDPCSLKFGMEDGRVQDSQITASSWLHMYSNPSTAYRPREGRLNFNSGTKGWCSEAVGISGVREMEYLQVDLLRNVRITGIATQNGVSNMVKKYKLMFKREEDTHFRHYLENWKQKVFAGNSEANKITKEVLNFPVIARTVRIVPVEDSKLQYYCLRMEVYGCDWKYEQDGLQQYIAPSGNKLGDISLEDSSYDGAHLTLIRKLTGGLGKLTDGVYGGPLSQLGSSDLKNSQQWVGYQNVMPTIKFKFSKERYFHYIKVTSLNADRSVAVFGRLEILVLGAGRRDSPLVVAETTNIQRHIMGVVDIQVAIRYTGNELQMQFTLHKEWLLMSEIEIVTGDPGSVLEPDQKNREAQATSSPRRSVQPVTNIYAVAPSDGQPTSNKKSVSFPIVLTAVLVGVLVVGVTIALAIRIVRRRIKHENNNKRHTELKEKHLATQPFLVPGSTSSSCESPCSPIRPALLSSTNPISKPPDRSLRPMRI